MFGAAVRCSSTTNPRGCCPIRPTISWRSSSALGRGYRWLQLIDAAGLPLHDIERISAERPQADAAVPTAGRWWSTTTARRWAGSTPTACGRHRERRVVVRQHRLPVGSLFRPDGNLQPGAGRGAVLAVGGRVSPSTSEGKVIGGVLAADVLAAVEARRRRGLNMHYLLTHLDDAWALTVVHLRLSLVPVLIGLAIAVPLGVLVQRAPMLRRLTTATASVVFTIPSLALFVVVAADHRHPDPRRGQRHRRADGLHHGAVGACGARSAGRGAGAGARRGHRRRLLADHPDVESRTAAVYSGAGRRVAGGRGDEYRDGVGGFGDRHRRPGHLVHRGLPNQQERPDPRRHHRDVRARDRHRHADRCWPAGWPRPGQRAARSTAASRSVVAPTWVARDELRGTGGVLPADRRATGPVPSGWPRAPSSIWSTPRWRWWLRR